MDVFSFDAIFDKPKPRSKDNVVDGDGGFCLMEAQWSWFDKGNSSLVVHILQEKKDEIWPIFPNHLDNFGFWGEYQNWHIFLDGAEMRCLYHRMDVFLLKHEANDGGFLPSLSQHRFDSWICLWICRQSIWNSLNMIYHITILLQQNVSKIYPWNKQSVLGNGRVKLLYLL